MDDVESIEQRAIATNLAQLQPKPDSDLELVVKGLPRLHTAGPAGFSEASIFPHKSTVTANKHKNQKQCPADPAHVTQDSKLLARPH